jgi:hypothetical protein
MKAMSKVVSVFYLAAMALGAQCAAPDERSAARLLDSQPPSLDAEAERLRRLQMVKVIVKTGDTTSVQEHDINWLMTGILANCPYQSNSGGVCSNHAFARSDLCIATTLIGATTGETPVVLKFYDSDGAGNVEATVLPQTAAVNAAMAKMASEYFNSAILNADDYLRNVQQEDCARGNAYEGTTYGAFATSVFVQSYHGGIEALEVAVKNQLAAADAQTATTTSVELATARAVAGKDLSRAAAAHLLVGGDEGLAGNTTKGFCTAPGLSGPAQTALALLRQAAPAPTDVLSLTEFGATGGDVLDTNTFLNTSPRSTGSVQARLAAANGRAFPSNVTVQEYYGLATGDFEEARRYMAQEIQAFSRPAVAALAEPLVRDGVSYSRFAATAAPPAPRHAAYYEALARTKAAASTAPGAEWFQPDVGFTLIGGEPELARLAAWARMKAKELIALVGTEQATSAERAPLETIAADGTVEGLLYDFIPPGSSSHSLTLQEYDGPSPVYVVSGDDGLQCAVQGSLDGAPCYIDDYVLGTVSTTASTIFGPRGRWYLVAPRVGGSTLRGPGQWKALVGFYAWVPSGSGMVGRYIPISPEYQRRVAEILAPSREWCTASQVSCAGGQFDERIPLQDELMTDVSGVEASWKHYLTLAQQAATESDALAKDYLQAAQALAQREEDVALRKEAQREKAAAELENLQQICGSAVDIDPILDALGGTNEDGDGSLAKVDQGPWPSAQGAIPPFGTKPVNGRAVADLAVMFQADSRLAALQSCLASMGETVPFMQLGDADLCLWTLNGDACAQDPNGQCPWVKALQADPAQCTKPESAPSGASVVPVSKDDSVHYFQTDSLVPQKPDSNTCDKLRAARKSPTAAADAIASLRNSGIFSRAQMAQLRPLINYHLDYNNHIEITYGTHKARTGPPSASPSDEWPCAASSRDCANRAGLFCDTTFQCDTVGHRLSVAQRLVRAVVAAHATTWRPNDARPGFEVPVFYTFGVGPLNGTTSRPLVITEDGSQAKWSIGWGQNPSWRIYAADGIPGTSSASHLHDIGNPPLAILGYESPHHVGFGPANMWWGTTSQGSCSSSPGVPPDTYGELYGGLSNEMPANGYFVNRLNGATHAAAIGATSLANGCFSVGAEQFRIKDFDLDDIHDDLQSWQLDTGYPLPGTPFMFSEIDVNVGATGDESALMDALELLCEASVTGDPAVACDLAHAPTFTSLADLSKVGSYLQCMGDGLKQRAATTVFANVPKTVVADLAKQTASQTYTPQPGDMGDALSKLRIALIEVSKSGPLIGETISKFGDDMKAFQAAIQKSHTLDELASVQFEAQAAQQLTSCATAVASAAGLDPAKAAGSAVAAGITCVNAVAQIGFADKVRSLQQVGNDLDRTSMIADFDKRFSDAVSTLDTASKSLSQNLVTVNEQLGNIEGLKKKAWRIINKAVWLMSQQAKNTATITTAIGVESEIAKERYHRAHDNAKRLSFLAKRAIEQRLGMRLAEMREDMPLVAAPATWESTLCSTSGLDFASLSNTDLGADRGAGATIGSFADSFIGEYVTKLQNVVESYRLKYNFHEGSDTAVISLRDDVTNTRAKCAVESENLLYHASKLDHVFAAFVEGQNSWFLDGCKEGVSGGSAPDGGALSANGTCIQATPTDETPVFGTSVDSDWPRAYKLAFGDGEGCSAGDCWWQAGAALVQKVHLGAGRYRYSWYAKQANVGDKAGVAITSQGRTIWTDQDASLQAGRWVGAAPGWDRLYFTFALKDEEDVRVGFQYPPDVALGEDILVGAPMLEQADSVVSQNSTFPRAFSDTGDTRTSVRQTCEDSDGSMFRATKWGRGCMKLCPDGYSSDCEGRAQVHCYRDLSFSLSQRALEQGWILNQSGFALGNFNYRIDTLGLNFVGTGVRNCSGSDLPTTCYAGGFVTYSLEHQGPYYVRNHLGADFKADLFTGTIEHARGLGNERYVTNPLGSADKSLMDQYLRREFQGRPLDGNFILRVWEAEGVDFNAIQDVQIVLNYRYWTRFN